ncbi:MAG: DUF4321 domain-containing protein [Candidatus Marinimicrobia bacterium]|nr:DUF4321 domain-containing protein [Candidatus Neomarinimicrobiota bacterium]
MSNSNTMSRIFLVLFLGAIIGGILGEVFGLILPDSVVKEFFLRKFELGVSAPFAVDLHVIAFSLSLVFRMNIVSLIGLGFGYYILRYTR